MRETERLFIYVLIVIAVFSLVMLIALRAPAEVHGNVQLGYITELDTFEAEINIQYSPWYFFTLYGGVNVLMEYYDGMSYSPYSDRYTIGTKINLTEHLYFDLYHHCVHPVYSYAEQFYDKFAGGNKTKISMGVEW